MNEQSSAHNWKEIWVTISIIAVNVIVYLVLEWMGDTEDAEFMLKHGAAYPTLICENHEYWSLLSSAFLHFGFSHLFNNMVMLACAGPILERALGHFRYLLLYLLAATGGSVLSVLMMYVRGDYAVSAGASGAIFGVVGGLLWIVLCNRGHYEGITTKRILLMIVLCLFVGITTGGVDNWGHLGGLITGFLACVLLASHVKEANGYGDKYSDL